MFQTANRLPTALLLCSLLVCGLCLSPARAGAESCGSGNRPAASLLFPYFEADLEDPGGRTTLVTIASVAEEPVLAHVVVWTTCNLPILDFTLYLGAGALRSLDLRHLIARGRIPVTGPEEGETSFPSCGDPVSAPLENEEEIAALRARFLGRPDPADGLCYAVPAELAVGYITVDVLNDCSDIIRTPRDEGYFASGGTGLASNANVLWGELYLVDDEGNNAQGFAAVPLVADASLFADGTRDSFWDGFTFDDLGIGNEVAGDDRMPLSGSYRARFLNGAGFDGGTEIILWYRPGFFNRSGPAPCDSEYGCAGFDWIFVEAHDERGAPIAYPWSGSRAQRGNPVKLETAVARFGTLDILFLENCSICSPPFGRALPAWVMPIHNAAGRFSVGLDAVRLHDPCE